MNVSLTPKLEAFVRRKVAGWLYNNASEVVREALRLLLERDQVKPDEPTGAPVADRVVAELHLLEPALGTMGVTSIALFGSVLKGSARPDSDIDLLVDIDPSRKLSLVDLARIGNFLEDTIGHRVDLVTREGPDSAPRQFLLDEVRQVF